MWQASAAQTPVSTSPEPPVARAGDPAAFVPIHIHVWDKFPVWYHLFFLITLAPLVAFGGTLMPSRTR